jgi:hypothetical protein
LSPRLGGVRGIAWKNDGNRKSTSGIEGSAGTQDSCGCSIQEDHPKQTEKNKTKRRDNKMSSNSNSSNKLVVPSAREAMNKFKMEAANEVDVPSTYYEIMTDEQ